MSRTRDRSRRPTFYRTAGPEAAGLGVRDEDLVIDLSPINSASSDPEFDCLDEKGYSQFAKWLEESFLRLKAGQSKLPARHGMPTVDENAATAIAVKVE